MSPSGKAPDFDSGIRRFKSGHPSQKSENFVLGFFICAAGTTSFARKGNIISSEARTSLPLAAQMNEVEALPQMMLRQVANDVGLRPMKLRFAQTELDRSLGFDSKVFRNFVDAFQRRALLGASFRVCRQIRTSVMQESKSCALPLGDIPFDCPSILSHKNCYVKRFQFIFLFTY